MKDDSKLYDFIFRGILTEEALDRAGRKKLLNNRFGDFDIEGTLSIALLEDDLILQARQMSVVYTAIAAFENSVRKLISTVLLELHGENWWKEKVSEKIRSLAQQKIDEEAKIKWHSKRGIDPINYTLMKDLDNIIRQNWVDFEPYIPSIDWAAHILGSVERSRNVIMHSGQLERGDIERIGILLRDWVKQVGA